MEILDIVNENNELINKRETRKYIHDNFLWHRHVSCWIINEKGEILLQKRAAQKKKILISGQKQENMLFLEKNQRSH